MSRTYGAMSECTHASIKISRPVLNQDDFDSKYKSQYVDLSVKHRISRYFRKFRSNPAQRLKEVAGTTLPIVSWLQEYNPKTDLIRDFIAGCTVGIMNIPQGMAYGILALLPPEYGLYTSFFAPLVYAFLGTSKHVSFGTFAVISLMVRSVIEKTVPVTNQIALMNATQPALFPDTFLSTETTLNSDLITGASESNGRLCFIDQCGNGSVLGNSENGRDLNQMLSVAFCLTFLVGIFQICFGLLQAGFLAVYLSDQLVEGLTTGAAVQVFTSQVAKLFGITGLPSASGFFGVFKFYLCFSCAISNTNWMTVINSACYLCLLIIAKVWIEQKFKRTFNIPMPTELLVIILATVVSYSASLKKDYNVVTVGHIPKGIPAPSVPDLSSSLNILPDAIAISIVIFSISVSMGKLFAKKHDYKINANQEWFAYGVVHLVSSFFSCHCAGSSLSRSVLQDSQGGKTQLASLFSSLVILVVLLALAPLFKDLPHCALAAVIVVNLRSMFSQVCILPKLWHRSKIDFLIWIVTFSAVVFLDITYGLLVGVVFAMMTVLFRTQWPDSICLGNIPGTEIYKGINAYCSAVEVPGIKIYRFDSPLYFANAALFKEQLYRKTSFDPFEYKLKMLKRTGEGGENDSYLKRINESSTCDPLGESTTGTTLFDDRDKELFAIIIDCSSFPYIDLSGADALKQVFEEYAQAGLFVLFCCVKVAVRQLLETCEFYDVVPKNSLYLSVHDAVLAVSEWKRRSTSTKTESD